MAEQMLYHNEQVSKKPCSLQEWGSKNENKVDTNRSNKNNLINLI